MKKKIDRSELVKYIQNSSEEIKNIPIATEQYPDRELDLITSENWLEINNNSITVDCRSESEYLESHLPNSINFPILNDKERDEVGFLYKHFSPNSALFHANKIAESKKEEIKAFIETLKEYDKIYIYCWRGGARSAAFTHILKSYNLPVEKLIGGYKSFRKIVHTALYENPEQFEFIVLSGLTGSGKTEILEKVIDKAPVLDIEKAALHASSLLGKVRFNNLADTITSQQHFETRLFMQLYRAKKEFPNKPILTESESRKISNFELPIPLFKHLCQSKVINIDSSVEVRAKRTAREYFYDDGVEIRNIVYNSGYFKKKLGVEKVKELINMIDSGEYYEFCLWFLREYYDKNYKSLYSDVIATINGENIESCIEEILKIA